MKKPLLAAVLLGFGVLLAGCGARPVAQTNPPPTGTPTGTVRSIPGVPPGLGAVTFANAQDGFVGGMGVILATTDGGGTWTRQWTGAATITALDFVSPQVGWAVGTDTLLATSNGGQTWSTAGEPASTPLTQVDFVSGSVGYGVAGPGGAGNLAATLVATDDGGQTWRPLAAPGSIRSVCFSSSEVGWAVTGGNNQVQVVRTTDAGQHWVATAQVAGGSGTGGQVGCSGSATAWVLVVGWSGMSQTSYAVYRTADAGGSWQPVLATSTAGAGPAPGNPSGAPRGPGSSPGQLQVISGTTAVQVGVCRACGGSGTALLAVTADGGSTWQTGSVAPGVGYPYPGRFAVSFVSARQGWLVDTPFAGASLVMTTSDGGRTWTRQGWWAVATPQRAISFLSPQVGFGVGLPGDSTAVLATSDGGAAWQRVGTLPQGMVESPSVLSFVSPTEGFAVTGAGRLLATSDGGGHWRDVPVAVGGGSSPLVMAVAFADAQHGCVQVNYPTGGPAVLSTSDGGQHWQTVVGPQQKGALPAVAVCAATLVHPDWAKPAAALASAGSPEVLALTPTASGAQAWGWTFDQSGWRLLTSGDFGATWTQLTWSGHTPVGLSFVDASHGWLLTAGGRLYGTEDGGQSWTQLGEGP